MLQNLAQFQESKDPYLTQKILSAKPDQLISYIYDAIITACYQKNQDRALRGLMMLVKALDFEYHDVAMPLFKLYQYCLDQVRENNFDDVNTITMGLKAAWVEATKVA